MKPVEKHRLRAKVTKRYDRALTPYARPKSHDGVSQASRSTIETIFASRCIVSVSDQIENLPAELERIALTKDLAPNRRANKTLNRSFHPEVLDEAMNEASRRI